MIFRYILLFDFRKRVEYLVGKVADGLNGGISYVAHASSEALAHGASCCTYKASGSLFELDVFCLLRVVIKGA